jgi:C-terminal processing protease CtpA/Prc
MPDAKESPATYAAALDAAVRPSVSDRAILVDLRGGALPSLDQRGTIAQAWEHVTFAERVTSVPLAEPRTEHRYLMGFPPEALGAANVGYSDGRESEGTPAWIIPGPTARDVPAAFIADASSQLPMQAVALALAGRAGIFAAEPDTVTGPGEPALFEAGDGLTAALRYDALAGSLPVYAGSVEDGRAWLSTRTSLISPPAHVSTPVSKRYASRSLPDEPHRVLAAFRIWGTIACAFPYRDLMHDDWDAALRGALRDLRAIRSPLDYELALRKMYAHIHDSHGFVEGPASQAAFSGAPAFIAREVEGSLTIVRVDPAVAAHDGFRVGDVIDRIDGVTPEELQVKWGPYVAASTPQSARAQLELGNGPGFFSGPLGTTMTLTVHGADGKPRTVRTRRRPVESALLYRTRPTIDVLPGNVGYLDLARLTVAGAEPALQRLAGTRALVLDLRGYPRETAWVLAPHFTDRAVRAALIRTPVRREPVPADETSRGVTFLEDTRDFYQIIAPKAPRYAKPIVVVIDVRAVSRSEHTALYLRASANARFVGEASAGANGEVTSFQVPGDVTLGFSGEAILHPDGSPLQRVGILPDVRISPTLAGVRAGEDELLGGGLREALRETHAAGATAAAALAQERARERADALAQQKVPPQATVAAADAPALAGPFALGGVDPTRYSGGTDEAVRHRDGQAIVLRAGTDADPGGYATYRDTLDAKEYRGKRVRVSGWLRTQDAPSASFFFSVVHGEHPILERSGTLVGDEDWTPFAVVVDVPSDASTLLAGLWLSGGHGAVWADDLKIDIVDF